MSALFTPIRIGNMTIRNRIVMAPMTTAAGNFDETPNDRLIAYYAARAAGGAGLITMEVCTVHPDHRYQPNSMGLWDDRFIAHHEKLVAAIHHHGAKIQPQISHPGPESLAPFFAQTEPVGPSIIRSDTTAQVCRALTLAEIAETVERYGDAALRAQKAGYDGIELHAAHAYMLLGSFLSPIRNKRDDAYAGNTFEGRTRLLFEVVDNIRAKCGRDFPVTVRLSGYERTAGGRDIGDTQRLAALLVARGVDAFHISGGTNDALNTSLIAGSDFGAAFNLATARAVKQAVNVPVFVVGRIHDPALAEKIIADGDADCIAMGRPLLADPELPNKLQAQQVERIRRCISCETCIDSMLANEGFRCAVNADCGREGKHQYTRSTQAQRVLVVGAGAAGMEAARICAERGHHVVLCERGSRTGGSLTLAATVHHDNEHFLAYLRNEITRLPIDVRCNTTVTPAMARDVRADAIIVATGARVQTLQEDGSAIPGSELPHVWNGALLRALLAGNVDDSARQVLAPWQHSLAQFALPRLQPWISPALLRNASRVWLPFGKRIVIIGADLASIELAEFLARRGRDVCVLHHAEILAPEIGNKRRREHMLAMDQCGIRVHTLASDLRIDRDSVQFANAAGLHRVLPADSVIIAGRAEADLALHEQLQGCAAQVHAIGDCTGLGLIAKATRDAMRVAAAL